MYLNFCPRQLFCYSDVQSPLRWYLFLVEEPNNQYLHTVQEPGTQVLSKLQLCLCLDFVLDFVQDSVIF